TRDVVRVDPIAHEVIAAQIAAVVDDIGVDAVKIGVVASAPNAHAVATALDGLSVPVVLDPVVRASTGATFAAADVVDAIRRELLPQATLVTPNLAEAGALCGRPPPTTRDEMAVCGIELVAMGAGAALVTGGHLAGTAVADVLIGPSGSVR